MGAFSQIANSFLRIIVQFGSRIYHIQYGNLWSGQLMIYVRLTRKKRLGVQKAPGATKINLKFRGIFLRQMKQPRKAASKFWAYFNIDHISISIIFQYQPIYIYFNLSCVRTITISNDIFDVKKSKEILKVYQYCMFSTTDFYKITFEPKAWMFNLKNTWSKTSIKDMAYHLIRRLVV